MTRRRTIKKARQMLRQGDAGALQRFLEPRVIRYPHEAELTHLLGVALIQLGREPSRGVHCLLRSAALAPTDPLILVRVAWHILPLGFDDEVRRLVALADKSRPDDFVLEGNLLNLKGRLATISGDEDGEAERLLRAAVRLEPESRVFRNHLSQFLESRGRHEEARAVDSARDDGEEICA